MRRVMEMYMLKEWLTSTCVRNDNKVLTFRFHV